MTLSYEIKFDVGTPEIITGIELKDTFNNGDIIEIDADVFNVIGTGSEAINITGTNGTYNFKINIITTNETTFTLEVDCFKALNIIEFTFDSSLSFVIGNTAFKQSKLTQMTLPKISTIGNDVFQECVNLVDFNFGNNTSSQISVIPEGILSYCTSLGDFIVPNYITEIGNAAFSNSTIKQFTFATTSVVNKINQYAFAYSTIPRITVPESVITIDSYAFQESKIPIIELSGNNLTTINDYVFYNTIISEINLPLSLTHIGTNAFAATNIIELILPKFTSYCVIEETAFAGNDKLQNIIINGNIKNSTTEDVIDSHIFFGCMNLRSVQFYNGLKQISNNVFTNCVNLNELIFIDSLIPITIKENAFENCGFDYLKLAKSVGTLEQNAFKDCHKLQQVVMENTTPIMTGDVFNGCTSMTEFILTKDFVELADDNFILPNESFTFYVFTPTQKNNILKYTKYTSHVTQYPYYNRNFINVKAIYEDEHDVGYVMYTLPNSNNTFNDCTFYFKIGQSSNPIVVIQQSDDGIMTNCVKMYSTTTDEGNKEISKIYRDELDEWKILLSNGTIKLPQNMDQTYSLSNNFICNTEYDGNVFNINGASLQQCDMSDLSNLTSSGQVIIENVNKIKLTSLNNSKTDEFDIKILGNTGQQIFEVNDIDSTLLKISGKEGYTSNITLVIENTIRPRTYPWAIEAPRIIINNLTVNYTIFQQQQEGVDEAVLTKIECVLENTKYLLKFSANKIINFYTIQNKNNNMFSSDSTEINALYYISGWTM